MMLELTMLGLLLFLVGATIEAGALLRTMLEVPTNPWPGVIVMGLGLLLTIIGVVRETVR